MDDFSVDDVLSEGVTEQDFITHLPSLEKAKSLVPSILRGDSEAITKFRKIYWLIFSGLISGEETDKWVELLTKHRENYDNLQKDQKAKESPPSKLKDPNFFHPLSNYSLDVFSNQSKNEELKEEIWKDITRTFPESSLFQTTRIQEMLLRLLFTWSIENPNISYKQGMNELMGFFLIICHSDRYIGNDHKSLCFLLCSEKFIEADTYSLFCQLMNLGMKPMFDPNPINLKKNDKVRPKSNLTDSIGFFNTMITERNRASNPPIRTLCDYIFHTVLQNVEPTLYRHIKSFDLEPQIFLLRWIRLLFLREFHFFHTICIWDAIFADHFSRQICDEKVKKSKGPICDFYSNLDMVIYFTISMLKFVKESLLESDMAGCLKRLLRFPPIESISLFVKTAIEAREEFNRSPKQIPAFSDNSYQSFSPPSGKFPTNLLDYNRNLRGNYTKNTTGQNTNTQNLDNGVKITKNVASTARYEADKINLISKKDSQSSPDANLYENQHAQLATNANKSYTPWELPIKYLAQHSNQIKNSVTHTLELQNCELIKEQLELIQHDLSMLTKVLKGELPYDPELFIITPEDL